MFCEINKAYLNMFLTTTMSQAVELTSLKSSSSNDDPKSRDDDYRYLGVA